MKKLIILGLIIVIIIINFDISSVDGPSMEPTYHTGQKVVTSSKRTYSKDDVVVFDYLGNKDQKHIKRVVGTPGDTISKKDGYLMINEEQTDIPSEAINQDIKLGDNQYFVVGDNYNSSFDSRNHGPITYDEIEGKVIF